MNESGISAQTTQQTHSVVRFGTCKYIGLTDLDEYIVSPVKNFWEILDDFEWCYDKLAGLSLETVWFGCGRGIKYDKYDYDANFIDKLVYRSTVSEGPIVQQKSIVNPRNVNMFSVHFASSYNGYYV